MRQVKLAYGGSVKGIGSEQANSVFESTAYSKHAPNPDLYKVLS